MHRLSESLQRYILIINLPMSVNLGTRWVQVRSWRKHLVKSTHFEFSEELATSETQLRSAYSIERVTREGTFLIFLDAGAFPDVQRGSPNKGKYIDVLMSF